MNDAGRPLRSTEEVGMCTRIALTVTLLGMLAAPAFGQDATGEQARVAIAGNTIRGEMLDGSGPFTEFFATDGAIRGKDYEGAWSVERGYEGTWEADGDSVCVQYGAYPTKCRQVRLYGGEDIAWIEGGKVYGTGKIIPGNPFGY